MAASDDSNVARDETSRALAEELRASLVRKQDEELLLWFGDIDAALGVGRIIRALRLSSQPPKAGVMFPPELARRLSEAATAALLPEDLADRWIAVLEAVAFSPVRTLVTPTVPPTTITDDLRSTMVRLGPALPQIAALLGVEVPAGAPKPKPLRQQPARKDAKKGPRKDGRKAPVANDAKPAKPADSPQPAVAETPEPAASVPAPEPAAPVEVVDVTETVAPVETADAVETADVTETVAPVETADVVETAKTAEPADDSEPADA